jgi:MutS domain V
MIARYEQRAAAHAARRDEEMRLSARISRLRLASFLPGAALVVWSAAHDFAALPLIAGGVLLFVFAVLMVWHARVDERVAWFDALHVVNRHALARIGRAWDVLPPAEPPLAGLASPSQRDTRACRVEHHQFAIDLDLFGRASAMQWLGPAATAPGTETLQRWLLWPSVPRTIAERQQGVASLADVHDWREELAAHGRLAAAVRPAELEHFLRWAESAGPMTASRARALRGTAIALAASIWLLLALQIAGVAPAAFWLVPMAVGVVISFATAWQVHAEFHRAGAGQHAFTRYANLFAHAGAAPAGTACIKAIQARLAASGSSAPERLRQLNRILGFAKLGSSAGIFHFIVQALTLWDFHVFFALDAWRRAVGPGVRGWMQALGELDALTAFAQVKADNPGWCFPEIIESPRDDHDRFLAANLGHPLIHDERRVGNDVEIGPQGTLLLITGSNMSGKSTLLRAVGLNIVFAQAGAPVCATSLRMPPVDLATSIRVQDSLEQGLSYFMAALARLKGIVDRARHPLEGRVVLYLLDEILQGTNTAERAVAVRGVARQLLKSGAIGAMTTHDLAIASEEPMNTAARFVHFTETVDEHGAMSFDYRLRPGLATSRNALKLMHLIGIDVE